MASAAPRSSARIIPLLRYKDAAAAIEWLCRAFGFEKRVVVPGENGTITHAQLTFGNSMVMLGSLRDETLKTPAQLSGVATQAICVIVEDADSHHGRAAAAGAVIVSAPADFPFGGRGYSCLDPEGHPWNFGTYDPWE